MSAQAPAGAGLLENFEQTHTQEEELRAQTLRLVRATEDLLRRIGLIENAMVLLFVFTHDHKAKSQDELTLKMLGIRLFNTSAAAVKLGLSGYYSQAFALTRDIIETGFLIDLFRTSPEKIAVWRNASEEQRKKLFSPVKVRIALDERDGNKEKKREKAYAVLSENAAHATARSFMLTMKDGMGQVGSFVDEEILRAWLEELVLRVGPAALLYSQCFGRVDATLDGYRKFFAKQLREGVMK